MTSQSFIHRSHTHLQQQPPIGMSFRQTSGQMCSNVTKGIEPSVHDSHPLDSHFMPQGVLNIWKAMRKKLARMHADCTSSNQAVQALVMTASLYYCTQRHSAQLHGRYAPDIKTSPKHNKSAHERTGTSKVDASLTTCSEEPKTAFLVPNRMKQCKKCSVTHLQATARSPASNLYNARS